MPVDGMAPLRTLLPIAMAATALFAGCNRSGTAPTTGSVPATGGASATSTESTTTGAAGAAASTPLPVSPSGSTNASTAAQGNDLSNSTRAGGSSNTYQPPSTDNAAPGAAPAASSAASSNGQSTSSQTLGTSVPPNDGTLPQGTTGSNGSRRGGGKD